MKDTNQQKFWQSDFGKEYTERNRYEPKALDEFYKKTWGVTRTDMNKDFLSGLSLDAILEVGANIGNQLAQLQGQGFVNQLYGIEIQRDAVEKAKSFTSGIDIIQGSAFDIPFKDAYFDMVFTSGVLIHISPDDVKTAIMEMYRTSKRYIWGFEYFAETYTDIEYRGNKGFLWKANFPKLFLDTFPDLKLVKEKKYKYVDSDNIDVMYLLEKV